MMDEVNNAPLEALRKRWEFEKSPRLSLQLAEEYGKKGDFLDAITVLRSGLESHPGHIASQILLGRFLVELEQWPEAREQLERVAEADPTHLVANKLLVRTYLAIGETAEARNRLDLYILLNESDPEIETLEAMLAGGGEPSAPAEADADAEVGEEDGTAASAEPSAADVAPSEGPAPAAEVQLAVDAVPAVPAEAEPASPGRETKPAAESGIAAREGGPWQAVAHPRETAPPAAGFAEPFGDVWGGLGKRAPEEPSGSDIFDLAPRSTPPAPAREVSLADDTGVEARQPVEPEPAPVGEESIVAAADAPPTAPAADTPEPESTVSLGRLYLEQGHRDQAERTFAAVLDRDPESVAARIGLAAARSEGGWSVSALDLVPRELLEQAELPARRRAVVSGYLERMLSADRA